MKVPLIFILVSLLSFLFQISGASKSHKNWKPTVDSTSDEIVVSRHGTKFLHHHPVYAVPHHGSSSDSKENSHSHSSSEESSKENKKHKHPEKIKHHKKKHHQKSSTSKSLEHHQSSSKEISKKSQKHHTKISSKKHESSSSHEKIHKKKKSGKKSNLENSFPGKEGQKGSSDKNALETGKKQEIDSESISEETKQRVIRRYKKTMKKRKIDTEAAKSKRLEKKKYQRKRLRHKIKKFDKMKKSEKKTIISKKQLQRQRNHRKMHHRKRIVTDKSNEKESSGDVSKEIPNSSNISESQEAEGSPENLEAPKFSESRSIEMISLHKSGRSEEKPGHSKSSEEKTKHGEKEHKHNQKRRNTNAGKTLGKTVFSFLAALSESEKSSLRKESDAALVLLRELWKHYSKVYKTLAYVPELLLLDILSQMRGALKFLRHDWGEMDHKVTAAFHTLVSWLESTQKKPQSLRKKLSKMVHFWPGIVGYFKRFYRYGLHSIFEVISQ